MTQRQLSDKNLKIASEKPATKDTSETTKNLQGKMDKYFFSKNYTASDTDTVSNVPATCRRQNRKTEFAGVLGKKNPAIGNSILLLKRKELWR